MFHYNVARGCEAAADQNLDHNESIRVDMTTSIRVQSVREGRSVTVGCRRYLYYAPFER